MTVVAAKASVDDSPPTALASSVDAPPRPVTRSTARVCERKDHDVLASKLIGNRERKAIKPRHPPIVSVAPWRCRFGEATNQREGRIDLVLQLGPEAGLPRFVVVDLVIDLGHCEAVDSQVRQRARAARRCRTWTRYSSSDIVSAIPASTSAPRRSTSASHASAAPASGSVSRLRINASASRARSSAGSPRISASMSAPDIGSF